MGKRIIIVLLLSILVALPASICEAEASPEDTGIIDEEKALKETLHVNPQDYIAATRLGEIYWEKGKRKEAIRLFRKAVKINPEYPPPYFFLGRAYFFEKKPQKGIERFRTFENKMDVLVSMDESLVDFYVSCLHKMNYMYLTAKRYKDLMMAYRKIVKLKPDDQRAHYNLAVCYYNYYHNRAFAYKELQKVIEIDTNRHLSNKADFFIDYMRKNPDARYTEDISFIEGE